MSTALKAYFKQKTTIAGIVVAVMFQLIFSIIWMTGYDNVTDNMKNLKIAVVNEDQGMGKKIAENLSGNLPFHVELIDNRQTAADKLNDRGVHMVVVIPADFSKQVQTPGQKGQLQFQINESNASLVKSVMQSAAATITATVNKEAINAGIQGAVSQTGIPAQQVQAMASGLSERVTADIQSVNKVTGMANQMVPMMMVLASFVGSMIMGMNLQQSYAAIGSAVGKWQKFGAQSLINAISAVVVALVGSSLVLAFGGQVEHGFAAMWAFQALFLFTFMVFTQLFVMTFGMGGMLFNIIGLSLQLVTSGTIVPRDLLSDFYIGISKFLPATYAVEGSLNILFGGSQTAHDVWILLGIALASVVLTVCALALRKEKSQAMVGQLA